MNRFFFLYRELCEESMNHSASSASSLDSHAPSESSSQLQGMRWEEQQKLLALEQLCGVFRVDLGHMRSLRLFFRSAEFSHSLPTLTVLILENNLIVALQR